MEPARDGDAAAVQEADDCLAALLRVVVLRVGDVRRRSGRDVDRCVSLDAVARLEIREDHVTGRDLRAERLDETRTEAEAIRVVLLEVGEAREPDRCDERERHRRCPDRRPEWDAPANDRAGDERNRRSAERHPHGPVRPALHQEVGELPWIDEL